LKRLRGFAKGAKSRGDIGEWRRARAVILYAEGKRVIAIAEYSGVSRGSVNRWLQWYDKGGLAGLRSMKRPGRPPRLSEEQRAELVTFIEAGPTGCGFDSGIWTGPMIGELIRRLYGVRYHFHHIPKLLHSLGFSVQRPRKRLARADHEKQAFWLRTRLPAIKKSPRVSWSRPI
jgi:transposase